MRTMGDSTNMNAIPLTVNIAAVYDDGHLGVETPAQLEARFPSSRYGHVFIDVTGARPDAQVRDWETGDKGGSLQQWVADHNDVSGRKNAVVYCNRATIPEVRHLTGNQVLGEDYWLWVSTLDNTLFGPAQYPHVVACQIKGASLTGGNWDMSLVFSDSLWLPHTGLWTFGPVRHLIAYAGITSVKLMWDAPSVFDGVPPVPAPAIDRYEVAIGESESDIAKSYPRFLAKGRNPEEWQGGSLQPGTRYTAYVRAGLSDMSHSSPWATITFTTGR